ncbi:MAG: phenylalanine--tRNA ligase beta subunit [Bacteroidia bacterium]|nr:MAG: phenylalanine--tRNA ligase beta subunit [Bacteroidia bacterium]
MKISHAWLRTLVPVRLSPRKLADGLSMLGLEVERVSDEGARYEGFVVGEILTKEKHPNADRLTVCRVSVGDQELQIVCGAPNVAVGQKVAVGLVGSVVPRNQHDPHGGSFVLQETAIRGVTSRGMICSEYELDLGDDKDGILVLDSSANVGTPLAAYLGKTDVVYEVEITANRGDWLSHLGVAREVSAMTGARVSLPKVRVKEDAEPAHLHVRVKVQDTEQCGRYVARVIRNVTIAPSPPWLQQRLRSVGVRPINNVVDITNFVMLETGQPLHAFDYDKIAGGTITVRGAREGERFTTLDGVERTFRKDMLLICDAKHPLAIAGVMGGSDSEISAETTNVLLESAWFAPVGIRRTSKQLGLSTEASQRFERSVDIEMTDFASIRAAALMQELAGGKVLKGCVDVFPRRTKRRTVRLSVSRANALLGTSIAASAMAGFLRRLGMAVRKGPGDTLNVVPPSYRSDIAEEVDLIEEIARLYGYDRIEPDTNVRVGSVGTVGRGLGDEVRDFLIGAGFQEIMTNSLQNRAHAALAGGNPVAVLNPVSVEMQVLRTSLVPGALDVIQHNFNRGAKGLRLFEIGKVYWRDPSQSPESLDAFHEEERFMMIVSGDHFNQHYTAPSRKYDVFDLKGELEALLSKFFLDKYRLILYDNGSPLSVDTLAVEIKGTYAGLLGCLKKEVAAKFDIREDVFFAEVSLDFPEAREVWKRRYEPLPRFPSVTRDLAFIVDEGIPQGKVVDAIREAGGELVRSVTLFDLYSGEQVGSGKKGLAYTLEFQPVDRTLTDEEVNGKINAIIRHVEATCGARLRR